MFILAQLGNSNSHSVFINTKSLIKLENIVLQNFCVELFDVYHVYPVGPTSNNVFLALNIMLKSCFYKKYIVDK